MPIEVLAPAGSYESLEAARRAGADAVYFGAGKFNARRNAQNFEGAALTEAISDCRAWGLKTYLTLNVLVSDAELPDAIEVAKQAAEAGISGVIVQDLGIAKALHTCLPDLPLHASTQLSIHSPAALPLLRKMGFVRVVAAREMTREELQVFCAAAKQCGMTVEVFVHGALCMCLSGQCYYSAMLGGRSGNRGLCAGPCRLPALAPNGTGNDLSLKDLSLLSHIGELRQMGVASLKIEGRMKRPEYVAAAVAAVRSAVDTGKVPADLEEALFKVFSRTGFTDGYFTGRRGREMFGIRTKEDVDQSPSVFSALHAYYRAECPRVPLKAEMQLSPDTPVRLTLTDGEHSVSVSGVCPAPARGQGLDAEALRSQCGRLGGTPYWLEDFSVQLEPGLFLPTSTINALRREAADALTQLRRQPPAIRVCPVNLRSSRVPDRRPFRMVAKFASPSQLPSDMRNMDAICLPVETDFSAVHLPDVRLLAHLPRGISEEKPWIAHLERIKKQGVKAVFCGNLSSIALCLRVGLTPIADFGLNLYNSEAAAQLEELGVGASVVSFELTLSAARRIASKVPLGLFAYGRQPLMLTRNCPAANGQSCADCSGKGKITDRKGISFPIRCRAGFSEMLNANVLWLADRLEDLAGFDFLLLSFTTETSKEAADVLEAYASKAKPPARYTRGLYDRGVE